MSIPDFLLTSMTSTIPTKSTTLAHGTIPDRAAFHRQRCRVPDRPVLHLPPSPISLPCLNQARASGLLLLTRLKWVVSGRHGSPDEQIDQSTPDPPSAIGYVGRKNTAYEIWIFTRAIETDENVPAERWPDDYNQYLTKRPDTMFVGCKFCTQLGKSPFIR